METEECDSGQGLSRVETGEILWLLGCQGIKPRPTEVLEKEKGNAQFMCSPLGDTYGGYFASGEAGDGKQRGRVPQRGTVSWWLC